MQEAESLKNRILGLEERLEFSQASPTTPLILPPPASRNIGSSGSGNQEKTSIESLTPPASLDAAEPIINAGVNDTANSTSRTTINSAGALDAPSNAERTANITKEAEVAVLKDSLKKLQEQLIQSQQECSELQERELTLKQTLERESRDITKDVSKAQQDYDTLWIRVELTLMDLKGLCPERKMCYQLFISWNNYFI